MKVRFWGVRGSLPSPLTNLELRSKVAKLLELYKSLLVTGRAPATEDFLNGLSPLDWGTTGGNTPCVEVRAGDKLLIFDAGSGIRELGEHLMANDPKFQARQGELHWFFSHTHWDHIHGMPFFSPLYIPGQTLHLYSAHDHFIEALKNQYNRFNFPVPWDVIKQNLHIHHLPGSGSSLTIGSVTVRAQELPHPGQSFSFRIEHAGRSVVYATDGEYKDTSDAAVAPYVDFFRDADVLIFDTQYAMSEVLEKEDWGHSTPFIAIDLATSAHVKNLLLFHHAPGATDERLKEALETAIYYCNQVRHDAPTQVQLAIEGLEVLA